LLERITEDISSCDKNTSIWFVYPALNIGYYRSLDANGKSSEITEGDTIRNVIDENHYYSKFRSILRTKSDRLRIKAITYPCTLYEPLYKQYEKNHFVTSTEIKPRDDRIKGCAKDAEDLVKTKGINHIEIPPNLFPQPVIIIGDFVYSITSYGLPDYDLSTKSFVGGEREFVSFLVYRRQDKQLAKKITKHLSIIADKFPPTTQS
jgi:hypothetical protein